MVLFPVRRRWTTALPLAVALILLSSAAPALAQPTGSIAGRVTDAATGRPVAGVTVTLRPRFDYYAEVTALTNDRGRYRFDRLQPGDYLLNAHTSASHLGEISDGRLCHPQLNLHERFGFGCGLGWSEPPWTAVAAGRTTELPFALDRGGVIAGRVTAAATGEPLAGAWIQITTHTGAFFADATAGADGSYRSGPLPAGRYRVFTSVGAGLANELWQGIHCDGRTPGLGDCDPRIGEPVPVHLRRVTGGIDFELERLGTIAGRITDAATGEPLAGIQVVVQRGEGSLLFGSSGGDGRYEVSGLLAGEYRVYSVGHPEHVGQLFGGVSCPDLLCDPADGEPVPVAIDEVAADVDFALDRGASISGTVTAGASGEPLAGIHLRVRGEATGLDRAGFVTGVVGRFRIAGLPADSYRVHTVDAYGRDHADEAFEGVACGLDPFTCEVEATPVTVALGEQRTGVHFRLEALGAITGIVAEQATGAAIRGLSLVIYDPRGGLLFASTDGQGRYVGQVPRGSYFVRTEAWGRELPFVDQVYDAVPCFRAYCDPAAGTPVEVQSGFATGDVDFDLARGAEIVGRVTREGHGPLFAGATVTAVDALGRFAAAGRVDGAGEYRLRGLPDGDYRLVARADFGLIDEVHAGIQCVTGSALGCDPLEGAPVHVEAGTPPPAVDFALAESFRPGTPCRPSPNRLCLAGGRFEVGVKRFTTEGGGLGRRRPISDSAGAFTFFADDNVEAVVRVVDACAAFDRFWVLATSVGEVGAEAGVRDTVTGESRFYLGLDFEPALDTGAFATCDAGGVPAPAVAPAPIAGGATAEPGTGNAGACVPSATILCLLGGRFAVTAEWNDGAGGSGIAGAAPLGDRSGYLWFHRPGSPEIAVKMLDACTLDAPRFWLFAGGLTNSEVSLTVTDTASGETLEVVNPLGQAFLPVQELGVFDGCP